jgi:hypothetical protein
LYLLNAAEYLCQVFFASEALLSCNRLFFQNFDCWFLGKYSFTTSSEMIELEDVAISLYFRTELWSDGLNFFKVPVGFGNDLLAFAFLLNVRSDPISQQMGR